jgi:hypothetical protein
MNLPLSHSEKDRNIILVKHKTGKHLSLSLSLQMFLPFQLASGNCYGPNKNNYVNVVALINNNNETGDSDDSILFI